jgi:hypothetical protein
MGALETPRNNQWNRAKNGENAMREATGHSPISDTSTGKKSPVMSPLDRARIARHQNRNLPVTIKTAYLDDDAWVELAQARGWKLPQKATPASSAGIAPWLKRLGLDKPKFRAWCGYSPAEWCKVNPNWSLRALVGLLLEDYGAEVQDGTV